MHKHFLSTKFDNVLSTSFVYHLGQEFFHPQTALGQWHSSLDPQFIRTSPWLYWKSIIINLHKHIFEPEIWQRIEYFFHRPPRSIISSLLEPNRIMTLLHSFSNLLNKSLTILKVTFYDTAQAYFFEPEIWQRIEYIFRWPPISKITYLLAPTRIMTLLRRPSIHLNKSFTTLKVTFYENAQAYFFEPEIWQRIEYFFCIPPKPKILSPSDCTRAVTLLPRPSIDSNKSLTILKVTYYQTAQTHFLSPKFDNVLTTFFIGHLVQ